MSIESDLRKIEKKVEKIKKEDERREEIEIAASWALRELQESKLDTFGGYPGNIYLLGDTVFILDPGMESSKYADLTAYKADKLIESYKMRDNIVDVFKQLSEIELKWDSVIEGFFAIQMMKDIEKEETNKEEEK